MKRDQKTVYCDTGLALGLPSERRSCLSAYRYTMGSPLEPSLTLSLSGSAEAEGSNQSNRKSCDDTEAEEEGGGSARKKLRLSKEQSALLEERFKEHHTLNPKQKHALAKQLNLRPRQVEVWFQNRRARTKLKQTEVECEFLKKCCQTLIGENQRLQRELNELKFAPRPYMQQPPPVCPACQKIAGDDGRKGGAVVVRSKPVLLNAFTRPAAC